MPKNIQKPPINYLSRPRSITYMVLILIAIIAVFCVWRGIEWAGNNINSSHSADVTNQTQKEYTSPDFITITPGGASVGQLGGWQRLKSDVYAYTDRLDNVLISVSEQLLPSDFTENTEAAMENLASKFHATTSLQSGNTTIYIGTSAKGPQSVIFTKNSLLIMIKSESKISNKSWQQYVDNLE